ncbi:MAG: helix-turn-helix transcriptional regulator [Cellvibrio sp.]|nr:helix-turn-helix transcriptional regulator [Cellvibrio sp.]
MEPKFDRNALVKKARIASKMSQISFGIAIKREQETISRYESGGITPPDDVVMRCIRILEKMDKLAFFSEDQEMVRLIEDLLAFEGKDNGPKRAALKSIMTALLPN